jgi:hypothetical protein
MFFTVLARLVVVLGYVVGVGMIVGGFNITNGGGLSDMFIIYGGIFLMFATITGVITDISYSLSYSADHIAEAATYSPRMPRVDPEYAARSLL